MTFQKGFYEYICNLFPDKGEGEHADQIGDHRHYKDIHVDITFHGIPPLLETEKRLLLQ